MGVAPLQRSRRPGGDRPGTGPDSGRSEPGRANAGNRQRGGDPRFEVWAARAVHAQIAEATGVVLPVRLWDGTGLGEKDAGYTGAHTVIARTCAGGAIPGRATAPRSPTTTTFPSPSTSSSSTAVSSTPAPTTGTRTSRSRTPSVASLTSYAGNCLSSRPAAARHRLRLGSLLAHAADRYGVRGVGVTLSATQAEAGRQRIAAAGLADRVRILQTDYRELDGRFDAVASVGMFEHVGPDDLGSYFAVAHRLTADGGLFLNHGIVTGDAAHVRTGAERTFVSSYVFPDGGLVPACGRCGISRRLASSCSTWSSCGRTTP